YKHNNDQANLALTTNPYGGNSWRQHLGARLPTLDADYLSGSKQNGQPRDNQHGWFYHIENAYNLSANLWIKDWYTFVGEFRKTFLNNLDPFPDNSSRAMGHALNHAIQAYRVTGDISLLNTAVNVFINTTLSNRLNEVTGINRSFKDNTDGLDKEAAFQMGFLARSLIDLHEELDGGNQKIMDILTGFMEWNLTIGNFSYYIDITKTNLVDIPNKVANGVGVSKGTGFLLIDPQLWVASKLGRTDLVDHVNAYVSSGLNGGAKPFGLEYLKDWDGRFFGRLYTNHVLNGVTIGGDCDGVVGINLHDVICVSNEVLTPSGTSVGECDGIQGVDIRDVVCTLNKAVASEQSSR
ncbi:MAG: hypothetical protein KAG86_09080, partial [Gammaproteobacteria bacterium]|nr:hypothetical protein [Gammaproteobacteria bacterium]